jgi:Zn-dependent protease
MGSGTKHRPFSGPRNEAMPPVQTNPSMLGSIRFFRFAGITVYVHWSWFLVAVIELQSRRNIYTSPIWNVAEYLSLFVIVLLHEFGHSLACRQVGGTANEIVLWPLGGIAFVNPPPRPGAWLWSIAAGPLVNVVLAPLTIALVLYARSQGLDETNRDLDHFLFMIALINIWLLIFNMLPIYPLDGGQILQSILWFMMGRAKSLMVASVVGIVGAVALIGLAVWWQNIWIGILIVFAISRAVTGFQQARILMRLENAPRHYDAACPSCHTHPLAGNFWLCSNCRATFDTFSHRAECPSCGMQFVETRCPECDRSNPIEAWFEAANDRAPRDDGEGERA